MSKRDEFVTVVLSQLCEDLSGTQLETVKQVLNTCISDYEIEARRTEIVPADSFVPDYYGIYIAKKKISGRTDETIRLYNYYLMDFFLNKPAPINQMDSTLMLRYLYDYKKRKNICNNTLDKVRIIIGGFFEWAKNEGYVQRNFVASIDPIKYTEKPREPLTDEEICIFREACETYRERALVDFMLSTGVRIGEVAGLKWSDLDMTKRTATVFGKGSKYRTVFFSSTAKVSLLRYKLVRPGNSPFVFVNEKYPYGGLKKGGIACMIRNIDERADMSRHVSAHILRHTFATQGLARGMSLEQLRVLLGHENVATTLIYSKVDMSQIEYEYKKCFA